MLCGKAACGKRIINVCSFDLDFDGYLAMLIETQTLAETSGSTHGGIRGKLQQQGWARFDAADLDHVEAKSHCLAQLSRYADQLPVDRHGGAGRHRSYAEGVLAPNDGHVAWKPGFVGLDGAIEIEYRQEIGFQPEYGGVHRRFLRTSDSILALPLIRKLIRFDLTLTPLSELDEPLLCGLHVLRMRALPGVMSRITPDCLHQDGQPFTAVHLIDRTSAVGGVNYIAPPQYAGRQVDDVPDEQVRAFSLHVPLESYIIDDAAVSHHVTSISCAPGAPCGMRTVILIDFTPLDAVVRSPSDAARPIVPTSNPEPVRD
ncbi:2OG-Fe dioxygenase family protein [Burkholderia savannae]|uniref:2OG-Fe dioxygenase family protein n=1 Tax=Burkholderia savannae TaxID=1637837 RepID=UPI001CF7D7BE